MRKVIVLPALARLTSAPNAAIMAGGGLISCVAIAVMIGWHVKSVGLVQIFPGHVPMQFNTALGFLICGIALVSGVLHMHRLALISGGLAFAIGSLTLAEYAFGLSLGIDELFVSHFTSEQTLYRGRMAISTASSFTLAGVSVAFLYWRASVRWRPEVIACAGSVILGMGIVSHIGYISSTDYSYGFGIFSRMAIHTAIGFEIIGACLVALAWQATQGATNRTPQWLAIPLGVGVATAAFVLWQALAIEEDMKVERSIFLRSDSAAIKIENQFTQSAEALTRMGLRWEIEGGTSRENWEADALNYLRSDLAINSIALADRTLLVQWVVPNGTVESLGNVSLTLDPQERLALDTAIEDRAILDAGPIASSQTSGSVDILVPIFNNGEFDGIILGELNLKTLLDSVSEELYTLGYVLALYDDSEQVYESLYEQERAQRWERSRNIEIQGKTWRMTIWPTEARVSELKSDISLVALFMGLFMAAITAIGVNRAQTAGSRARIIAEANRELSQEVHRRTTVEQALRELNANLEARTSELQEAKDSLETEVAERRRAEESLLSKTTDLERSNTELERFAYVASHDLQTPLRTIVGFSQILVEDYQGKIDPEADNVIELIVDAGSYMQTLINDLLEYSRIGSNFTGTEFVDTEELVKKQVAVLDRAIRDSGTEITWSDLPTIQGEKTMLDQVFRNLIGNSIKYRDKQPNQIHLSAHFNKSQWEFAVKDNGIGMESQYLERIFEVFQRLHLRENYEGTGIGLAICKKAVERLGGRIWAESAPGQGSTFYFTIPGSAAD